MKAEPFVHHCIVQDGPDEGNNLQTEVSPWKVSGQEECSNCGEVLGPLNEVVAHMYEQMLGD